MLWVVTDRLGQVLHGAGNVSCRVVRGSCLGVVRFRSLADLNRFDASGRLVGTMLGGREVTRA